MTDKKSKSTNKSSSPSSAAAAKDCQDDFVLSLDSKIGSTIFTRPNLMKDIDITTNHSKNYASRFSKLKAACQKPYIDDHNTDNDGSKNNDNLKKKNEKIDSNDSKMNKSSKSSSKSPKNKNHNESEIDSKLKDAAKSEQKSHDDTDTKKIISQTCDHDKKIDKHSKSKDHPKSAAKSDNNSNDDNKKIKNGSKSKEPSKFESKSTDKAKSDNFDRNDHVSISSPNVIDDLHDKTSKKSSNKSEKHKENDRKSSVPKSISSCENLSINSLDKRSKLKSDKKIMDKDSGKDSRKSHSHHHHSKKDQIDKPKSIGVSSNLSAKSLSSCVQSVNSLKKSESMHKKHSSSSLDNRKSSLTSAVDPCLTGRSRLSRVNTEKFKIYRLTSGNVRFVNVDAMSTSSLKTENDGLMNKTVKTTEKLKSDIKANQHSNHHHHSHLQQQQQQPLKMSKSMESFRRKMKTNQNLKHVQSTMQSNISQHISQSSCSRINADKDNEPESTISKPSSSSTTSALSNDK